MRRTHPVMNAAASDTRARTNETAMRHTPGQRTGPCFLNHEQAMPRDPDPRCLQTRQRLSAYHAPVVAPHSASAGTLKGRGG
eukprot:9481139-Alexandrium_andersonii.AAC.1